MHWYATPTASLGHMYVVPVINKAYATARVVGQARLLVFISFIMIVWSLTTFTKPSSLSKVQAVCQLTIHTAWIGIWMTKRPGATSDNGFIFKKININTNMNIKENPIYQLLSTWISTWMEPEALYE